MNFSRLLVIFSLLLFAVAAAAQTTVDDVGLLTQVMRFFDAIPAWLAALTAVLSALATLAALTETKKDDALVDKALTFLKGLAGIHKGDAEGLATKKKRV